MNNIILYWFTLTSIPLNLVSVVIKLFKEYTMTRTCQYMTKYD